MNTIYPMSSVNFLGGRNAVTRTAAITTNFLYRSSNEEALYKQTPKMQELVNQIFKYFKEQGKNAEDAILVLRKKFPFFSIQLDKNPMLQGENFVLRTNRETLYNMNKGNSTPVKNIDTYVIEAKNKLKSTNFIFTVTSPESDLNLYSVSPFFKKTNLDGTLKTETLRKVEDCLQVVVDSLKK